MQNYRTDFVVRFKQHYSGYKTGKLQSKKINTNSAFVWKL